MLRMLDPSTDIRALPLLLSLLISPLALTWLYQTARRWNTYMVSHFFLSHFLVLIGYILVFCLFSTVPWLLSLTFESLWIGIERLIASGPEPISWRTVEAAHSLLLIGLVEGIVGSYLSYKNYLKQAQ